MKISLSENIRRFRKDRKMTQEKLAEALGVTVGAVYKWESGLSTPELSLIVEMADLFDTSIDVLLGYRVKDKRIETILNNIRNLATTFDPKAINEAEKALVKYPNSFMMVYECAEIYSVYGMSSNNRSLMNKSLELFEKANMLISQNTNPRISTVTIQGNIAYLYFSLGEFEKGLEKLKENNADSMYSTEIGAYLSIQMNRTDEAAPFLSEGMVKAFSELVTAITGYIFVYCSNKNWNKALEITNYGIDVLSGMKSGPQGDSIDRAYSELLAALSFIERKKGRIKESDLSLEKAVKIAKKFDSNPNYSTNILRYTEDTYFLIYDMFGACACDSIIKILEKLGDGELSKKCRELIGRE